MSTRPQFAPLSAALPHPFRERGGPVLGAWLAVADSLWGRVADGLLTAPTDTADATRVLRDLGWAELLAETGMPEGCVRPEVFPMLPRALANGPCEEGLRLFVRCLLGVEATVEPLTRERTQNLDVGYPRVRLVLSGSPRSLDAILHSATAHEQLKHVLDAFLPAHVAVSVDYQEASQ